MKITTDHKTTSAGEIHWQPYRNLFSVAAEPDGKRNGQLAFKWHKCHNKVVMRGNNKGIKMAGIILQGIVSTHYQI